MELATMAKMATINKIERNQHMKKILSAILATAAAISVQAARTVTTELLTNGDCSTFDGWEQEWMKMSSFDGAPCFAASSSEQLGQVSQTVTLANLGFSEDFLQSRPAVNVVALYTGTSYSKAFEVTVYELDVTGNTLAAHLVVDLTTVDYSGRATATFNIDPATRSLKLLASGKCKYSDEYVDNPRFRSFSMTIARTEIEISFVSEGETVGTSTNLIGGGDAALVPVAAKTGGDYAFLGYYTQDGQQVFDGNGALVPGSLVGQTSDVTLYARWAPPPGSVAKLVYRGQLNLLTGDPAVHSSTYTKRMHFRVYDGSEATTPLWQTGNAGVDVTVNADGSFVYSFGDDNLAALIATGRVTHVGLALGSSASTAVEMKPRRELRPVAAVNRALTAEGAALDIRIGNLATENSLVAADATVSKLEVAGTVNAYGAGKVSVSPLTIGPAERTKLLRGKGVKVFSKAKPTVLSTPAGAILRGQELATAPSDGIALISSKATGNRALRCPAVIQYCRKGEKVRAPTSDAGGLKVTFFPFIGKEGR